MNTKPYFSLVIPTKNRAAFCVETIEDLLKSDFKEFEIIVVDNDDSAETGLAFGAMSDPRLRRIRTGGLTMHDNWQRGFDEAKGSYVFMGEDKITLGKSALSILARRISTDQASLLVWVNAVNGCFREYQKTHGSSGDATFRKMSFSSSMKMLCASDLGNYSHYGPHAINCVFNRDLGIRIQKQKGRLFQEMSPDYWSGAMILAHCRDYLFTDAKLGCILAHAPSNGSEVTRKSKAGEAFFRSLSKTKQEFLDGMPSSADILSNYMLADVRRALQLCGVPLEYGATIRGLGDYFLALSLSLCRSNAGNAAQTEEAQALRRDFARFPRHARMRAGLLALRKPFCGWPDKHAGFRANFGSFFSCWKLIGIA